MSSEHMPTVDTLAERLDRLEREVRWWRLLGITALVATGFMLLLGATHVQVSREIKAQRVVVVDENGKPRILLGKVGAYTAGESGPFAVAIADANGNVRARLGMNPWITGLVPDQPTLDLLGTEKEKDVFVTLQLNERGDPYLWLRGKDDHVHVGVSSRSSSSYLNVASKEAVAELSAKGQSALVLVASQGVVHPERGSVSLGLDENGQPSLKVSDLQGLRTRAVLGHAVLEYESTGVQEKRSASSLVLFGKDGKVVWKAP